MVKKIPFVSVGITRHVLMLRKTSNIQCSRERHYKVVDSRHREIPYFRVIGRQRRRGLHAIEQVIGRRAFTCSRKNVVSAAKGVGADWIEFAALEVVGL